MMTSTTLKSALARKESGNEAFKEKNFVSAKQAYSEALNLLKPRNDESKQLMVVLLTNRAAVHLAVRDWDETLKDCLSALEINPHHEKALYRQAQAYEGKCAYDKAFTTMKDLVRRNPKNKTWVAFARHCKEKLEGGVVSREPVIVTIEALRNNNSLDKTPHLKALITLTQEDEATAITACSHDVFDLLWSMRTLEEEQSELAIRALASITTHKKVVNMITPSMLSWCDLVRVLEGASGTAVVGVFLAMNILTLGSVDVPEFVAVDAWVVALSHKEESVRSAGMDGVVKWCTQTPREVVSVADNASVAERRVAQDIENQWKAVLTSRAVSLCKSPANNAIFVLLDSQIFSERQKALATFGHVMSAIRDEEELKALLEPILNLGRDLTFLKRKVALISALFLAHGDVGVWLLSMEGSVRECLTLIASGDEIGQALAAETLCLAASNEGGRSLLGPVVESGTLDALLDSTNARARSAAASTMAKLGVASRALTSESPETGRLLNTAMLLLKGAEESANLEKNSTAETQKFAESASVTTERAVEVLAALVTKSAVKDEICHGSGRCAQALSRLCAVCKDGKGASAYGLAHIFAALSVTNKEVQERLLAEKEMDISPDQLAELQRITKQKGEVEEDVDDAGKCNWRIQQLVQADGIRALVRLSDGASDNTKELIAMALRQIASEPSVRGSIIQQGGYKLCLHLASDSKSSLKCARDATWGLAKTLITTNPSILTAPQRMGCIAALLRLCKDHRANDLTHFEALMGLTNIASFAEDTKARIASENGIRALEYMQFSDHPLVRRASTECLTNMMPHQSMIEHLRDPEKLKLWCAFSEDYETDLPTACAAAGTLAMAAGVEDEILQETIIQSRACAVFTDLLKSGETQLAHRAALGIYYLSGGEGVVQKLLDLGAKPLLFKIAKKKSPEWSQVAAISHDVLETMVRFETTKGTIKETELVSS